LAPIRTANPSSIDDLLRRICAEYTEMPGLRVTTEQAQRLWGLDASTCHEALQCLVDVQFLTVTASGQYARLTEGPPAGLNLRMARAALARNRSGAHSKRQTG
jgi:hypothetical protein